MTYFIIVIISVIAFALGFLLGIFSEPPKNAFERIRLEVENDKLAEEYHNFLSYDGTEQL